MTVAPVAAAPGDATAHPVALEVKDVTVTFAGVTALNGVSFSARSGQVLGLIGPNGAGKTTLFDVITGLRRPDHGQVIMQGVDVTAKGPVARSRAGMRRTFQRQQVFGTLTAEENLLLAVEWRGGGGGMFADLVSFPTRRRLERERREKLAPSIEACGLGGLRNVRAGTLPIGGARMVELGRAAADNPSIVLLDEPTSGLGETEVEHLSTQVRALRDAGTCVLLIEHDITFVMEHSDRVVALVSGTILAEGTPDEIQANSAVRDAYLG